MQHLLRVGELGRVAETFRIGVAGSPFPQPSPIPSNFVFPAGGTYFVTLQDVRPTYMAQWSLSGMLMTKGP
jgi:hypothetical protein